MSSTNYIIITSEFHDFDKYLEFETCQVLIACYNLHYHVLGYTYLFIYSKTKLKKTLRTHVPT